MLTNELKSLAFEYDLNFTQDLADEVVGHPSHYLACTVVSYQLLPIWSVNVIPFLCLDSPWFYPHLNQPDLFNIHSHFTSLKQASQIGWKTHCPPTAFPAANEMWHFSTAKKKSHVICIIMLTIWVNSDILTSQPNPNNKHKRAQS